MPVELVQVLVQLGIGGVFIWYLQKLVDRQQATIDLKNQQISDLYDRIEQVRQQERDHAHAECDEYEDRIRELVDGHAQEREQCYERIEQLRDERDQEREQRFAAAADARDYLWQIANALNHLTQRERGERSRGDAPDDLQLGPGGGGSAAG